jgi:preprotein translocase subunit YajC
MIDNLKKGDRIVTNGGLHGRVTGITESTLTVEIADKVRVKVNRGSVAAVVQSSSQQTPAPKDDKSGADKK